MSLEQFLRESLDSIFSKLKIIESELVEQKIREMDRKVERFVLKGINLLDPKQSKTDYYKNFYQAMSNRGVDKKRNAEQKKVVMDKNPTFLF